MAKIIFLRGLPASGKSTWAKEYQNNNPNTVRSNKDDLRLLLHNGVWSDGRESLVLKVRDYIVKRALSEGHDVIVDDTNLYEKHEVQLREIAKEYKATFEIKDFTNVSVDECIRRDKLRPNPVGEKVIKQMAQQYGLNKMIYPMFDKTSPLPKAIVSDLDGTLAIHNGRSPYDYDSLKTDLVNFSVKDVLDHYIDDGVPVILLSGRPATHRQLTEEWLTENHIEYDALYMRDPNRVDEKGNQVNDTIIKRELYDKYIRGKYNVLFVLDDRDKIIDLWRKEIGIPCFQVNYGNF